MKKRAESEVKPQARRRRLDQLVLHPRLNDRFVATKKGKQVAIQVHDCRNGEVYFMKWTDGCGMMGDPTRCSIADWAKDMLSAEIDTTDEAWEKFYEKQNISRQPRADAGGA